MMKFEKKWLRYMVMMMSFGRVSAVDVTADLTVARSQEEMKEIREKTKNREKQLRKDVTVYKRKSKT